MKIKNLRSKLIVTAVMIIYALIPHTCIIKKITGLECFGCGMTRAVIAALRLDFKAAFSYHMMFWSVPLLYICFLFDGKLFGRRAANSIFYAVIAAGFVINRIM